MSNIQTLRAREVLDSRGNPTVEVEAYCDDGTRGRAIVPSGASTGRHEAAELRDGDPARFGGKGVLRAVANVHDIIGPELIGQDIENQSEIDRCMIELDGTPNKSRLGANAILGVSLACAHAAAAARGIPLFEYLADLWNRIAKGRGSRVEGREPGQNTTRDQKPRIKNQESKTSPPLSLPLPMVNMISGGLHAGGNLDFQDFLVMPVGAPNYREALRWIVAVYHSLSGVLAKHGYESVLVGDEGGFGPRLRSNDQAVELIVEAIAAAKLEPGRDLTIALDVASTHFFAGASYKLKATEKNARSAEDLIDLLESIVNRSPVVSIEDGCAEDDWEGWQRLTKRLGRRVQLIGDDLFTTNPQRLARGTDLGVANAILIKPNQIGTLSETLEVVAQAKAAGYRTIISARSGETEDVTIAHLAVATGAGQIKIGSVARSERLAKYNELLRIEDRLGDRATFSGNVFAAE